MGHVKITFLLGPSGEKKTLSKELFLALFFFFFFLADFVEVIPSGFC